jgi:hypothetical protein
MVVGRLQNKSLDKKITQNKGTKNGLKNHNSITFFFIYGTGLMSSAGFAGVGT